MKKDKPEEINYSASFKSKEQIWRDFISDDEAKNQFRRYAIQRNTQLCEIAKKDHGKWIKIRFS